MDAVRSSGHPGQPVPHWTGATAPTPTSIRGRYSRLEPLDPSAHATQLFAANGEDAGGRMWTYLPYGPFATLGDYRRWLESRSGRADPQFYAVVASDTDAVVGVAAYMRIDPANGSIEVGGLAYAPRLQGTRESTEAAYLLMKNAFDLGFRRVEWKCDSFNSASRRAAQRFGMSFEGIHRQSGVMKGRNRDTAWYSALDREWPRIAAAFCQWLDPENFTEAEQQRTRLSDLTRGILTCSDAYAP